MQAFVGVTDEAWFELLASRPNLEEANFWQPSGSRGFKALAAGRGYDLRAEPGKTLWLQVQGRLAGQSGLNRLPVAAEPVAFGEPALVRPRLGQGSFRVLVTDAYGRRCSMTGEKTLPVLEAAHIRGVAAGGAHSVDNGLLLRADLHTLFDRGYITVTTDHRIEVSRRIREEFSNGRAYYALHGGSIERPKVAEHAPAASALKWHNVSDQ